MNTETEVFCLRTADFGNCQFVRYYRLRFWEGSTFLQTVRLHYRQFLMAHRSPYLEIVRFLRKYVNCCSADILLYFPHK